MYELFSAVFPRTTFETEFAVIITFKNKRKTYNSIISPAIVPGVILVCKAYRLNFLHKKPLLEKNGLLSSIHWITLY